MDDDNENGEAEDDVEGGAEMVENDEDENDGELDGMDVDDEADAAGARVDGEEEVGERDGADATTTDASATEKVIEGSKEEAGEGERDT